MAPKQQLYGWNYSELKKKWYYTKYCKTCEQYRDTEGPEDMIFCPICKRKMRVKPHKTGYDIQSDLQQIQKWQEQQRQKLDRYIPES